MTHQVKKKQAQAPAIVSHTHTHTQPHFQFLTTYVGEKNTKQNNLRLSNHRRYLQHHLQETCILTPDVRYLRLTIHIQYPEQDTEDDSDCR